MTIMLGGPEPAAEVVLHELHAYKSAKRERCTTCLESIHRVPNAVSLTTVGILRLANLLVGKCQCFSGRLWVEATGAFCLQIRLP